MPRERRNLTFIGRKRRSDFERSVQKLRDLGLPAWALEYYRRLARMGGMLPHEVVRHVAVLNASRQLGMKPPSPPQEIPAHQPGGTGRARVVSP